MVEWGERFGKAEVRWRKWDGIFTDCTGARETGCGRSEDCVDGRAKGYGVSGLRRVRNAQSRSVAQGAELSVCGDVL